MKSLNLSATLLFLTIILLSCSKPKPEKVIVNEWSDYHDPAFGFKVQYPKNWYSMGQSGKAIFYLSEEIANNFLDPVNGKRTGAEISVRAERAENGMTIDQLLLDAKNELQQFGNIKEETKITIAGNEGIKVTFETPITTKLSIWGYSLFISVDTLLFEIGFRAFGDYYEAHNDVFAAVEKSFVPPTIIPKTDSRPRPSEQFDTYDTQYFTLEYPSNFNFTSPSKGSNEFVIELKGERLDCTIRLDIFGANKWTVEKVFEDNLKKYKSVKSKNETVIDGLRAMFVNYSPANNIESRAYFLVKNNKVYRITLNWFAPEKELYIGAFEKIIQSLKIKDVQ
ncbi:MAG: hypothetical protein FJ218_02985 [Ignavibacteria bacterium]|nr:hypothetical protein [Ignavibacteria bacterium]